MLRLKSKYTIVMVTHSMQQAAFQTIADGKKVNQAERDIKFLCTKLLLQQQPAARDLRLISSALKMVTDMERIGSHAQNIAEWVEYALTGRHKGVFLT